MKKLLVSIFVSIFVGSLLIPVGLSAATTSNVVQLEITTPTTARAGEAIDISVRAVDKDKKTVSAYRGSVIFNTDNIGDTVPMPGRSYTFTSDDNGEKKFSKGLIFKKSGKQKVYVTDVSEDIVGEATISVEAATTTTTPPSADQTVSIITPENGTKITSDTVMVSGKSKKNSKIIVKLNGKDVGPTNTDADGLFTKNLTGIAQETNILTAELVDGNNTTVATSPSVTFTKTVTAVSTYSVTVSPATTVEQSSPIQITTEATPGLSDLSVSIDGSILPAKETSAGKYTLDTVAPNKAGTYKISISQKDSLGQTKTTDVSTTLTVTEKLRAPVETPVPVAQPIFKNVKTTSLGSRVTFEFSVENAPADLQSFKIAYGKDVNNLSNETDSFALDRIASKTASGTYTWYIDNLNPDTYTFKIFGRTKDGALVSGLVSEPIVVTLGKASCSVGNVGALNVKTDSSKSVISWDSITGALSYNLYKVSPTGDYILFQNTKEPNYTLYLSTGAVTYDNFVVKALCDEKTESKNYSSMSKVQSGPGMISIIVIVSAIFGVIILRRRAI